MTESIILFAQQATEAGDIFSKIMNFGVPTAILFWVMKFAFPSLLDRNDKNQLVTHERFERIIDKMETNRSATAKDGHDAARNIGDALQDQCSAIRGNTESINRLADQVTRANG